MPNTIERPIALTFDRCSSYVSAETICKALDLQIFLTCLPAIAKHLFQSLNVAVFKSFKTTLGNVKYDYMATSINATLTKEMPLDWLVLRGIKV